MTSINSSKAAVYIEVSLFAASGIIITAILIIEAISWYFEMRTESVTNDLESSHTPPKVQMSIDIDSEASAPNTTSTISATRTATATTSTISKSVPSSTTSNSSNIDPLMRISPIITYISYICYSTTAITAKLGIGIHRRCNAVALPSFFYMFSKSCLYLVLLYRIYFVYGNSVFQKSTKMLKIAAVFTVFWGLFISIANVILLDVQVVESDDGSVYCVQTSNSVLVLLFILFDFIINIGCCYSFTRPLLWLSKMESRSSEAKTIYEIVVKYTILTVVAVSSTFLSLLLLILMRIQFLPALDTVVNSVCIMMFNKNYDRYYECLCCGAHKVGGSIIEMECCCGSKKKTDSKQKTESKK